MLREERDDFSPILKKQYEAILERERSEQAAAAMSEKATEKSETDETSNQKQA